MPTTAPSASSSGPPELPGLTAASVWTTPVVGKQTPGASIWRSSWETTPVESEARFSNGLPITATGSPTCKERARPERQRLQPEVLRIHLQQRRVLEEVVAEHVRVDARAVAEHDVDGARLHRGAALLGLRDDVRGRGDQPAPRVHDEAAARRLVVHAEGGLDRDHAVAGPGVERDRVEAAAVAAAAATAAADDGRDGRAASAAVVQRQGQSATGDARDERDDDCARQGGPRAHRFPV